MPTQYAEVISFNPDPSKRYGFARIQGTTVEVFIHISNKRRVDQNGWVSDCSEGRGLSDCPVVGDQLVVDIYPFSANRNGTKTVQWAFRVEWDGVYNLERGGNAKEKRKRGQISSISSDASGPTEVRKNEAKVNPFSTSESSTSQLWKTTRVESSKPKVHVQEQFTVVELLEVFEYHFLHAILDGIKDGEITLDLLQKFARNTPKGKRGEALWKEYQKWTPQKVGNKKTVAGFIRFVLEVSGFIV